MSTLFSLILDAPVYLLSICVLYGIWGAAKYSSSIITYWLGYLCILLIAEFLAMSMRVNGYDNRWIYNLTGILEFVTYLGLYSYILNTKKGKIIIVSFSLILFILIPFEILFILNNDFREYWSLSFAFSSLFISIAALMYIWEIVRTEKVLYLKKILFFWISIGLITFLLCGLPFTIMTNVIATMTLNPNTLLIIQSLAAILMYTCFILGLTWKEKKYLF